MTSTPPSQLREPPQARAIISAVVAKDLKAFRRDRFLVFISVLLLLMWAAVFYLLPPTSGSVSIGIVTTAQSAPPIFGQGVEVVEYPNESAALTGVETDEVPAGLVVPPDFMKQITEGAKPTVTVIAPAGVTPQVEELLTSGVIQVGYAISGQPAPFDVRQQTVVLGPDKAGSSQ